MTINNSLNRGSRRVTRRQALQIAALGAGGTLLAACAPAATQAPTSAPVATAVPPTAAPTAAPAVTLRYQQHWSKETDAHYEGMKWLFSSFAAKYPNITIKDVLIPDSTEMHTKTLADCAAGDCPEIIHEAGRDFWDAGYLTDLTPYIDADPAWKSILVDSTLFRADGKIYAICAESVVLPVLWNTRILDAAGVSAVPKTWDELLAAGEKIKSSGKLVTSWGVGGTHAWHDIVASQKGGLDALAKNQFDAPVFLDAFTRMKVFVDNKWIPDNEIELTWQQSIAQFVAEDTAFYLDGAWTIGNNIIGAGAAPDLKDVVVYAPFPSVGENGTTVELKKGTPVGLSKAVGDDPVKLDAGLKFLKHYFSVEAAKQWILLTKSPMGVKVDLSSMTGVDPLLLAFLAAQDQADFVYGLPETLAMEERGWDDSWSGLQALMAGKSAAEAEKAFVTEMSKYAS